MSSGNLLWGMKVGSCYGMTNLLDSRSVEPVLLFLSACNISHSTMQYKVLCSKLYINSSLTEVKRRKMGPHARGQPENRNLELISWVWGKLADSRSAALFHSWYT